ncbi:MAG TPA: DMT family transporter [Myxococcales bacterium]|nr:DMT family transporter [Myxococcales bacterium]
MQRLGGRLISREGVGVVMVISSAVIWPFMDAVARRLGEAGVPATQIAWGRYVLTGALLVPVVLARAGRRGLLPRPEPLHVIRAIIPAAIAVIFYMGLLFLPLASASALLFTNPLFITAFSALFLRERVAPYRWAIVATGFAGVLLVIRPGVDVFHPGALLPIATAIGFAALAVLNRKLAGGTPAIATTLHYSVVGVVLLSPAAVLGWRPFDATLVIWLAIMAAIGGTAMWLVTAAYERAEASVLAPFHYVELVSAVAIGFVVFRETPEPSAIAGIVLILTAGVAVTYRPKSAAPEEPPLVS